MMLTLSALAMQCSTDGASVEGASCDDSRWPSAPDESAGRLAVVQIREGEGRFLLSAAVTSQEAARATVDLSRDALVLRLGAVVRWVAIPQDALVNQAIVRISDGWLTVSVPLRVERKVRHVLHVW